MPLAVRDQRSPSLAGYETQNAEGLTWTIAISRGLETRHRHPFEVPGWSPVYQARCATSRDVHKGQSDFYRLLSVSASPSEVAQALREVADRLDLKVAQQPDGRLLLLSRWPDWLARIDVGVVAQPHGSRLEFIDATLLRGRRSRYTRVLMERVCESIDAALHHRSEGTNERVRVPAIGSCLLRIGETAMFALGFALVIAGVLTAPPWSMSLEIGGVWLALVGTWCCEILRRRVMRTSSREELVGLGVLLLVAAASTCVVLVR